MTNGLDIFTQALIYSIHIILKDSSMSDQIFYLFSAVLLGLVIGALIMYFATGTKRHSEQTIAKLEKELENYQQEVVEHFEQTADLVDDMTESYKKVFDHLGKSARKLMTEEQFQKQLELRKGKKVTLAYLTGEVDSSTNLDDSYETISKNEINEKNDSIEKNDSESLDEIELSHDTNKHESDEVVNLEKEKDTDHKHKAHLEKHKDNDDEADLENEVKMREKNLYN